MVLRASFAQVRPWLIAPETWPANPLDPELQTAVASSCADDSRYDRDSCREQKKKRTHTIGRGSEPRKSHYFSGLHAHRFFPLYSNPLIPDALQLFRVGSQGAETGTCFFREFSNFPSSPAAQELFPGKAL